MSRSYHASWTYLPCQLLSALATLSFSELLLSAQLRRSGTAIRWSKKYDLRDRCSLAGVLINVVTR